MQEYDKNAFLILNKVCDGIQVIFDSENGINNWKSRLNYKWVIGAYMGAYNVKKNDLSKKIEDVLTADLDKKDTGSFIPFLLSVILNQKQDLSEQMRSLCERVLKKVRLFNLDNCWDFIGVNDNTPAMIMTALFLSGEYFEDEESIRVAERRLKQFELMLSERKFISEFNSPTYQAVTIAAFAVLAEYSKDESIKKRALLCENQLWQMTFLMYHKEFGTLVGPYARAYITNSCMIPAQMSILLYITLGEMVGVSNPITTIFDDNKMYNVDFALDNSPMWCEAGWLASIKYHCPYHFLKNSQNTSYPIMVCGDAQISASADNYLVDNVNSDQTEFHWIKLSGENKHLLIEELNKQEDIFEYPAGVSKIFSYKNNGYSLGTCTKEFHNGIQTDSFHSAMFDGEEIYAIFSRYLVNNSENIGEDYGRKIAFQEKNTALVCYSPKTIQQEVTSLKLSVLIYAQDKQPLIYSGDKQLSIGDEIYTDKPVYLKVSGCLAAIMPLKHKKVRIEKIDRCLSVSMIDYEGKSVHFERKKLKLIDSGFAFSVCNEEEITFEEFKENMEKAVCSDELYTNMHTRFAVERIVKFKEKLCTLECGYSPITEGIKYIRINDKLLD